MPCVFPVLSLKALALRGTTARQRRRCCGSRDSRSPRASSLSFVLLARLLLALRAAGEQLGWGFQLQSPAVVTGARGALLRARAQPVGRVRVRDARAVVRGRLDGAEPHARTPSLSGVLAVVIASPCTAPFMGAALGFALSQPAALTLAVFVALGVGMALPFVLLSWFPGWRRRAAASPGTWMERVKQFLAFPLYATVAWLVWVLGAQVDNDAVRAPAGDARRRRVRAVGVADVPRRRARACFVVAAAAGLVGAAVRRVAAVRRRRATRGKRRRRDAGGGATRWQAFSPARVSELTAAGQPGVRRLHRGVVRDLPGEQAARAERRRRDREAFADRGVALVRADWTRRDPVITQALGRARPQGRARLRAVSSRQGDRCCCRRSCRSRRCSTRSRRIDGGHRAAMPRHPGSTIRDSRRSPCTSPPSPSPIAVVALLAAAPRPPRPGRPRPTSR